MGEIIPFPGNSEPSRVARVKAYQERRRRETGDFFIPGSNPADAETLTRIANTIEHLLAQSGGYSNETMQMRRQLVAYIDPATAFRILLRSDETVWQQRPTYYMALAEKAKEGLPSV